MLWALETYHIDQEERKLQDVSCEHKTSHHFKVCSTMAKYHGIQPGDERKPRRRPSDSTQMSKRSPM